MENKGPSYEAAAILFVLYRDTTPEGDNGLTQQQIVERVNSLSPEEHEKVDALYMGLQEDWEKKQEDREKSSES